MFCSITYSPEVFFSLFPPPPLPFIATALSNDFHLSNFLPIDHLIYLILLNCPSSIPSSIFVLLYFISLFHRNPYTFSLSLALSLPLPTRSSLDLYLSLFLSLSLSLSLSLYLSLLLFFIYCLSSVNSKLEKYVEQLFHLQ